jgi:hypothetical protein
MFSDEFDYTKQNCAKDIANILVEAGINVKEVYESDTPSIEDDMIEFAGGYHLQIGNGYLCLNQEVLGVLMNIKELNLENMVSVIKEYV